MVGPLVTDLGIRDDAIYRRWPSSFDGQCDLAPPSQSTGSFWTRFPEPGAPEPMSQILHGSSDVLVGASCQQQRRFRQPGLRHPTSDAQRGDQTTLDKKTVGITEQTAHNQAVCPLTAS